MLYFARLFALRLDKYAELMGSWHFSGLIKLGHSSHYLGKEWILWKETSWWCNHWSHFYFLHVHERIRSRLVQIGGNLFASCLTVPAIGHCKALTNTCGILLRQFCLSSANLLVLRLKSRIGARAIEWANFSSCILMRSLLLILFLANRLIILAKFPSKFKWWRVRVAVESMLDKAHLWILCSLREHAFGRRGFLCLLLGLRALCRGGAGVGLNFGCSFKILKRKRCLFGLSLQVWIVMFWNTFAWFKSSFHSSHSAAVKLLITRRRSSCWWLRQFWSGRWRESRESRRTRMNGWIALLQHLHYTRRRILVWRNHRL